MLHWVSVLIPPFLVPALAAATFRTCSLHRLPAVSPPSPTPALATYLWTPIVSVEDYLPPSTGTTYHRDARGWSTTVLLLHSANKVPPPPEGRGLLTCCFREVSDGGLPPDNAAAANVAPDFPASRVSSPPPWCN